MGWPKIDVPARYKERGHIYIKACFEGRSGTPLALTREWFHSELAFEAYRAGWMHGDAERRAIHGK